MAARHQQYMDLVPKSEWKDQPEATLLNIDLPGFTKEQIKVTYVHTTKTIRVTGERPLADRRWTRFNEAFTVPQNSLVDKIQGGFKNNVLTITIPKETITKMANLPETSKTKAAPLEKVAKLEEKRLLEESIRKEKEEKEAEQKRKQLLEEKDELIRKLQEDAKAKEMAEERKLQEAAKAKEMKLQEEKEAEERKLQEAAKAKEMKLQEEKEAEQKRKQLLEEKDELIRKLQEDAKAKEMAEERKLQEAAKAKEMKLQEAAKEKEKAEERKLQEAAKEKEKAEERKLQEEVKAKEKAEERKLVEEARLAKIQEKKSVDESRGKEKILKPEVVYRKSGPVSGHKSGTGGVGEVVKSAEEKLGNLVEKEKKMGKGIMEKIRRKEITREEKKMMMNVGVAALVIFALGAYVSYTFCSPSSSSSTKPE